MLSLFFALKDNTIYSKIYNFFDYANISKKI